MRNQNFTLAEAKQDQEFSLFWCPENYPTRVWIKGRKIKDGVKKKPMRYFNVRSEKQLAAMKRRLKIIIKEVFPSHVIEVVKNFNNGDSVIY